MSMARILPGQGNVMTVEFQSGIRDSLPVIVVQPKLFHPLNFFNMFLFLTS